MKNIELRANLFHTNHMAIYNHAAAIYMMVWNNTFARHIDVLVWNVTTLWECLRSYEKY